MVDNNPTLCNIVSYKNEQVPTSEGFRDLLIDNLCASITYGFSTPALVQATNVARINYDFGSLALTGNVVQSVAYAITDKLWNIASETFPEPPETDAFCDHQPLGRCPIRNGGIIVTLVLSLANAVMQPTAAAIQLNVLTKLKSEAQYNLDQYQRCRYMYSDRSLGVFGCNVSTPWPTESIVGCAVLLGVVSQEGRQDSWITTNIAKTQMQINAGMRVLKRSGVTAVEMGTITSYLTRVIPMLTKTQYENLSGFSERISLFVCEKTVVEHDCWGEVWNRLSTLSLEFVDRTSSAISGKVLHGIVLYAPMTLLPVQCLVNVEVRNTTQIQEDLGKVILTTCNAADQASAVGGDWVKEATNPMCGFNEIYSTDLTPIILSINAACANVPIDAFTKILVLSLLNHTEANYIVPWGYSGDINEVCGQ
jgi:hypothetical protein